jgi:hypothetical protein
MLNILRDSNNKLIKPNPILNHIEFMTDPVFIVGNGNSRKNFDLNLLKEKGTIIGCNALYREFKPDILAVLNYRMIKEVLEYSKENFCICLKRTDVDINSITQWKVSRVNSSGCLAIKIVSLLIRPSKCYMLGMDGIKGNIYNDTKNYPKDKGRNLDRMFKHNVLAVKESKTTKFINVNLVDNWPENTAEFMSYKRFKETIMG